MTAVAMNEGWKVQTPEVAARFAQLRQRPVTLDIYQLCKPFDTADGGKVVALDNVSFRVQRREFLCFIGASGCGKSTLIRIIAGLDPLTSGEVLLDGKPVQGPGPDRGMVFQGYTLFPWRTVNKNVMFGLEVSQKMTRPTRSRRRVAGWSSSA